MDSSGSELLQKLAQREAQRVLQRAREDEESKLSVAREKEFYMAVIAERLAAVDSETATQAKKVEQNKLEAVKALEEKHKLEWTRMERAHKEMHETLMLAASTQKSNLREMLEEENIQREARMEEKQKAMAQKRKTEDARAQGEVFEVFQGEIEKLTRGMSASSAALAIAAQVSSTPISPADTCLKRRIVDRLVEEEPAGPEIMIETDASITGPATPTRLEKDSTPSPKRQCTSQDTCQVTPPVSPEGVTRVFPQMTARRAHLNALASRTPTSVASSPIKSKVFGNLQRFAFVEAKRHQERSLLPPVSHDGSSSKAIKQVFQILKLGVVPNADNSSMDQVTALREWLMDKSSRHPDHVMFGQCQNSTSKSGSYIQRAFDLNNSCEMKIDLSSLTVRVQKESGSTLWVVFKTLEDFSSFQPCFLRLAPSTSIIKNAGLEWPLHLESAEMGCTFLSSPLFNIGAGSLKKL